MNTKKLFITALAIAGVCQWGWSQVCQNCGFGTNNPQSRVEIRGCTDDSTSGALRVTNSVDTTNAFPMLYVRGDKRVGINTKYPKNVLDVRSATTGGINIINTNASTQPSLGFYMNSTSVSNFVMGVDGADANKFKIGTTTIATSSPRFAIDASGNIGFNTNPTAGVGLHANGGLARFSSPSSSTDFMQTTPAFAGSGETPAGAVILTGITTSGRGLTIIPSGGGNSGVKTVMAMYNGSAWKSVVETQNEAGGITPTLLLVKGGGKVGIGTTTVPKGSIGYARLAIEGSNGNGSGPHVQFTTANDNYPLMQILPWTHDNVSINFDSYYDGTAWKSSDVGASGSCFQIYKLGDVLNFKYATSSAQGAAVTFSDGIVLDKTGKVGIGTTSPGDMLHVYKNVSGANWGGRGIFSGASKAVVAGQYNDVAIIAGHNAALNAWADLYVNWEGTGGGNVLMKGNVGIGTNSPEALLEVQGAEATNSELVLDADDGDDNTDTWFLKSEASGNDFSLTNHTTKFFGFTSDGRLYGTALHNNTGAVTGTSNQYVASGTYTPTASGTSNLSPAPTIYKSQWMRVGNVVTVSGSFLADASSAATLTEMMLTLPITSTVNGVDVAGVATSGYWGPSETASIIGSTDKALITWKSVNTSQETWTYTYTYEVK